MTVQQAIEALQKLPDKAKELQLMLDCPHCGHAQELVTLTELVVMRGKEPVSL